MWVRRRTAISAGRWLVRRPGVTTPVGRPLCCAFIDPKGALFLYTFQMLHRISILYAFYKNFINNFLFSNTQHQISRSKEKLKKGAAGWRIFIFKKVKKELFVSGRPPFFFFLSPSHCTPRQPHNFRQLYDPTWLQQNVHGASVSYAPNRYMES